ncbi:MAG: hypothetical protein FJX92_02160 [Bacteroidetes bacterium]|nr:hypothetical protein [Bacteroidota bacterium]
MLKPLAVVAVSAASVALTVPKNNQAAYPTIESRSKLIWKTQMGAASFRSNVIFVGDRLYIGSNGDNFRDYGMIEPNSGVYAIDRKTGKKIRHFAGELFGDMDVNGLLPYNNKLYFGNDNEEFLCTDLDGKIRWRNPTSGDIEHEPVLLKTKNGDMIVYAAESGEVNAVDPQTGKSRWSYYVPDFSGWKPGDNRTLFKVKAWFSNGNTFFTKPILVDVNRDGAEDLVYCLFNGSLLALNGRTGKELWSTKDESYSFDAVGLAGAGKERFIVGSITKYGENYTVTKEMIYLDLTGQLAKKIPLVGNNGGGGLNVLDAGGGKLLLNDRIKTYQVDGNGSITTIDRSQPFIDSGYFRLEPDFRNGYAPLFANQTITLANGKKAAVVLNQWDMGNYKMGFLEIVSLEDQTVVDRISYPGGAEMPPVIRDVNQDGNLDILISSYDGYLYCYELPKY